MSVYATLSYQLIDKLAQPLDYFYGYFDEDDIKKIKILEQLLEENNNESNSE